jgi:hypothetical protein
LLETDYSGVTVCVVFGSKGEVTGPSSAISGHYHGSQPHTAKKTPMQRGIKKNTMIISLTSNEITPRLFNGVPQ